jgi:drug/metabolite transporter (DMT)-like permease
LKNLPHLALVFNALVWGLSWIPYKWMESLGLSILWATAIGYLLSTAVLGLFQPAVLSRLLRPHPLWMMGLFYGLTNTCFNWALALGDVVRVVLLFYLMPLWAALFARIMLNERLSAEGMARLVWALAGAAVVLAWPAQVGPVAGDVAATAHALGPQQGELVWVADCLALAGGLFFGLANVYLRRFEAATQAERTLTMFMGSGLVPLMVLLVLALVHQFVLGGEGSLPSLMPPWEASMAAWALVPLVALFLGLANFSLQYGGSRLPTQVTALIMLSEIVFAAVSAALVLGKQLSVAEWVGGLMIVSAAVWASLRRGR